MAIEALLPSEIARLVYGYLIEEKCTDAAKSFLNESPNLHECRSFLHNGRTFTTRVCGLALLDILEKFSAVSSIVQDLLAVFDRTHKLKYCTDIVTQIKFLLDECRNQQVANSSNDLDQGEQAAASGTLSKTYKKRHSGKNEVGLNVAVQSDDGYQTETPPDSNSLQNIPSVEATPLEHLPGYVESLQRKKLETSWPTVVKTPTKITNKCTQSQQIQDNIKSQAVQSSDIHKICQTSQSDRKFQSQEVQTSFRITEANELLVYKPMANSIQTVPIESHEESEDNVKGLNTNITVIKNVISETGLCNNLDNYDRNQEVINLDDSEEHLSLESPTAIDPRIKVSEECIEILEDVQSELLNRTEIQEKIANNINKLMEPIKNSSQSQLYQESTNVGNDLSMDGLDQVISNIVNMTENDPMFIKLLDSIVKRDECVSSSEEIEMDIDYENPSSEENISNDMIIRKNNKCDPEVINIDSMSLSSVLKNVQSDKISEMTNNVIASTNTIVPNLQISPNNIQSIGVQEKCLVNLIEPSLFDKHFPSPPDFVDHNTSTPLKLFTATQNYDTNEWFSTQTLPSSSIVPIKDTTDTAINSHFSYAQTATESIVNPVDGFISPIICKESTNVAEKIFLNCTSINAQKDNDTLNTPDVPPLKKSFIPNLPAPVPATNIPQKDKTPVLLDNCTGENVSPNEQTAQNTSPSFNSISSLVKNTEFNRYFSIDSISLVQMDNTSNTAQNPSAIPQIKKEDSVGSTGTGLSPFLIMHKKIKETNAESLKHDSNTTSNVVSNKIEENQALLNEKIDETDAKVCEVAMKNSLDKELKKADCETKEVMANPAINQSEREIITETIENQVEKALEVITIDEIDNEVDINEDGATTIYTCEKDQSVDTTTKTMVDEVSNKINEKPEKDVGETLKTVLGKTIETNGCRKEYSKDATSKIASTLIQTESTKHDEPKVQTGTSKKESLKSFLSKTFESYIDPSKFNTASNDINEGITRNTPKVLLGERAKRRSLSTPKKSSSHIRALTFETPIQSRSDSKINNNTRCASPETAKRNLKKFHESFQSPPVVDCEIDHEVQYTEVVSTSAKIMDEREKVEDNKVTETAVNLSEEKEIKKENVKMSWDSDLRMLVGPETYQPKVPRIPKRKYRTKSKEESSTKKKKRDKSKTPRKEKKRDKSPHNKSKKSEKEKTPGKFEKSDKSKKHGNAKKNDGKDRKAKADDKLSAKDCEDLGAQIESNLLANEDNKNVNNVENNKNVDDKLSAKECIDVSAQIESNLMSTQKNKIIKKVDNNSKVKEKLSTKECKDASAKIENNLSSTKNKIDKSSSKTNVIPIESTTLSNKEKKNVIKKVHNNTETKIHSKKSNELLNKDKSQLSQGSSKKDVTNNLKPNSNQSNIADVQDNVISKGSSKVETNVQKTISQNETKPSTNFKTTAKKDSLVNLLSDSINDDDEFNDIMEIDSADITHDLKKANKLIDSEIMEKMQQDEQSISAVLEEANEAINDKYKSIDLVKQQDFFPETSLMTDGDESEEEGEIKDDVVILKDDSPRNSDGQKLKVNNSQSPKNNKFSQKSKEYTKSEMKTDKTASKVEVDYDSIEKQLSILTDTEVPSARKVIYDHVSKVEDGIIVQKKYARLKTLNVKLAKEMAAGSVSVLDSSTIIKKDDSIEETTNEAGSNSWVRNPMLKEDSGSLPCSVPTPLECPPTPRIIDPGSNSWVPNPMINEDSRSIICSVPTPFECPPTPRIFNTPQKNETEIDPASKKAESLPFYHLTPITFETATKSEVAEFEVFKETFKKTTPVEKKEEDSKTNSSSTSLNHRNKSSSHLDSEDSDSSSSSDSSDSSSSSSDDEDDCSMHPLEVVTAKEAAVEANSTPGKQIFIQNEEVVDGNEIMFVEHEEVVIAEESSPTKVFPIHKTDKELEETVQETPAKDENMIPEEGIFETPNISKPVDNPTNLHAKISQMMILKEQEEIRRLESQQKPKIINVSPTIVLKNSTQQEKVLPTAVSKDEEVKMKIVKKSESEVAKAIESIASEKFDKSLEDLESVTESSNAPQVLSDKAKKRELSKAIQSITKANGDEKNDLSSDSPSDDDSCNSSNDEPNLKLVLEDDSVEEPLIFDNCEGQQTEIHIVFDEKNYKKRRRRQFIDEEMSFLSNDEEGNMLGKIGPTCVDILFNLIPPKKKTEPKKKIKEDEEFDDGDSSEDFVPTATRNTRGSTKRRRSDDQPKSRKRKKNIFIY